MRNKFIIYLQMLREEQSRTRGEKREMIAAV